MLFCSRQCSCPLSNVHAGCDKQDSLICASLCSKWMSMLTAIHYCMVDCQNCWWHSNHSWSESQILVKNGDFCLPHLHSMPLSDYCHKVWYGKLEWCGYPMVKIFWRYVYSFRQNISSSSRMHVINHNWSAIKQRLHPQSVAQISHHSVLSGDRIRQCGTLSRSCHKDTDQCKSPFPSAGTAVSLFRAKTVQQRPLLPREVETWLPIVGENWPPEPTSSYAFINFWSQLVASRATAASWMSVVAMVG